MKVRLNLATEPLEGGRRFAFGAAVVGSIAVIAFILLATRAYSVSRTERREKAELAQVQAQIANLNAQRAQLETYFNNPSVLKVRDRAAFLNGLIEERSFPWTRIFMDLENLLPEGVRVVTISPKLVGNHIELHLVTGAESDEAKLKFLRTLETSRAFSHIQPVSETRPQHANDPDHVYLELTAWYEAS